MLIQFFYTNQLLSFVHLIMANQGRRSPDLASLMSKLTIDKDVSKPHVITIFISAHSVELKQTYTPPEGIEVRVVNSQRVPGRSNYENPFSIQTKLRFWNDAFRNRDQASTIDTIRNGIDELTMQAETERQISIAVREHWKPLRSRKDKDGNQMEQAGIIERVRAILASEEDDNAFYNNMSSHHLQIREEDPEDRIKEVEKRRAIFRHLLFTLKDPLGNYEFFRAGYFINYNMDTELLNATNEWLAERIDKTDEESTNKPRLDRVINDKLFVFNANSDETTENIEASLYGIHLIQDSKNEAAIRPYRRFVDTSNVLMDVKQELTDEYGDLERVIEYKAESVRPKVPTIKTKANAYFGPRMGWHQDEDEDDKLPRPYCNSIYLSEIIEFFQEQGYDILNIIDTGCRNFDPIEDEKRPSSVFDDQLSHVMRSSRIINKAKKALETLEFSRYGKKPKQSARRKKKARKSHKK